jgi:hypothetical protein
VAQLHAGSGQLLPTLHQSGEVSIGLDFDPGLDRLVDGCLPIESDLRSSQSHAAQLLLRCVVLDDRTVGAAHGTTLIGKHARVASLMSAVIDESSLLALIEWHLTTRTGPCSVLCIQ